MRAAPLQAGTLCLLDIVRVSPLCVHIMGGASLDPGKQLFPKSRSLPPGWRLRCRAVETPFFASRPCAVAWGREGHLLQIGDLKSSPKRGFVCLLCLQLEYPAGYIENFGHIEFGNSLSARPSGWTWQDNTHPKGLWRSQPSRPALWAQEEPAGKRLT